MTLTLARFAALVGQDFVVREASGSAHAASLAEAKALGGPFSGERQPFALLFQGPPQPPLQQGTYRVEHPAFEDLAIFLVPVGRSPSAVHYEAVFN